MFRRLVAPYLRAAGASKASPTTTPAAITSLLHSSAVSGSKEASQPPIDPFTEALQSKTQEELLRLIRSQREAALQQEEKPEDEEDELSSVTNPKTGEQGGPKGKEPTRYGDWEQKGRATDFQ